jgi:hypothetical protein
MPLRNLWAGLVMKGRFLGALLSLLGIGVHTANVPQVDTQGQTVTHTMNTDGQNEEVKYPSDSPLYAVPLGVSSLLADNHEKKADANSPSAVNPKEQPSSEHIDWGDLACNVFDKIGGFASIIALLDAVERRWREMSTTNDAHLSQIGPQPSETDIARIRLRMTHGPDRELEEWLTEPVEVKKHIDTFNQPGTTTLPLKVVFVLKNGEEIPVDVLHGTHNNPLLDLMLSRLKINPVQP